MKTQTVKLSRVKERNAALGKHWFDDDSMSFFDSCVHSPLPAYDIAFNPPAIASAIGGELRAVYFISSEQFHAPERGYHAPRSYTIRVMDWETGIVDCIGDFQQFDTLQSAQIALVDYLDALSLSLSEVR